ncbi:hypothetical protein NDU88_004626 [Pleurodeles waltl]|uniref:Uncharacterized protein n=1 Tax=Pleurodeles waltl TaxID=8319 RepID=A0AAV7VKU6_PLEWA|nr:hypothetical protein NDU88_004626 [Pleurodeles waltl]
MCMTSVRVLDPLQPLLAGAAACRPLIGWLKCAGASWGCPPPPESAERMAGTGAATGVGSPRNNAPRRRRVGPGPFGQSGVGSAHTSGVDDTDWRRHEDRPSRVSAQRCDDSDSVRRIEIQQDGTMAVVDPEQPVLLLAHQTWRLGCYLLILEYVDLWGILLMRLGWVPCDQPVVRTLLDWE